MVVPRPPVSLAQVVTSLITVQDLDIVHRPVSLAQVVTSLITVQDLAIVHRPVSAVDMEVILKLRVPKMETNVSPSVLSI